MATCEGQFSIETQSWCGSQGCPFWKEVETEGGWGEPAVKKCLQECGGQGGSDITITNKKTGESMVISSLMNHLIFYHHFYEGNTKYRADPDALIRLLEIDPTSFDGAKWEVLARNEKGVFMKI